ncbi:SGT1 protein-domain-containing protein [Lineolata rhizophorae]|uniref:SGT1 protein-domain-containing protein n=1 Tax=Lineolata rhizophorae TaxID=578093 RepID=A0A6A6P6F2_9PEZI|nr:SGT1 protein-domain-containing protein [Lineolata rhizophorae]
MEVPPGAAPDDGLKWFDEGFEGFPKRLPDDTVEYLVYMVDDKLSPLESRTKLTEFRRAAEGLTERLLKDYIWQRDAFKLELVRERDSAFLRGSTNFGDSIADEWLIVYLLRETSKQFLKAWVRIFDMDGEFLLIEAANVLPTWLNPEIAENRVWLNAGSLHIIPRVSPFQTCHPTLLEALAFIHKSPSSLVTSPLIESEAFFRLRNYPDEIRNSLHTALVTLPLKLAALLRNNPAYVSPAIEAFYLRDPVALRPLFSGGGKTPSLIFDTSDLVTASVRFTKVGYAQLRGQVFSAPLAWEGAVAAAAAEAEAKKDVKVLTRAEMGMKLACGFEMLLGDPAHRDRRCVHEIGLLLEDMDEGGEHVPAHEEMEGWEKVDEDEGWLDIDFEEFEAELSGKRKGKGKTGVHGGFGDKAAQETLRKTVERFEAFLNDESAGMEGADGEWERNEVDEDEEDEEAASESNSEDKAVSFDEEEFDRMMREMMGISPKELDQQEKHSSPAEKSNPTASGHISKVEELDGDSHARDDMEEDEKIQEEMMAIQSELASTGVLNLDSKSNAAGKSKAIAEAAGDSDEESTGELDIDANLAKNILESFKSQAGMAGPTGNMLGLMGLRLPRDGSEDNAGPSSSRKA